MESDTQKLIDAFGESLVDPTDRLLFADAVLGHEAQMWLKSQVGRYIAGRAKEEVNEFLEWAMSPDACASEFEKRRAKALAARTLLTWTTEQIQQGLSAEHRLAQIEARGN